MENDKDDARASAKRFRDYAAECRRLGQRASAKDHKVLMEIADAWIVCAKEAERKEKAFYRINTSQSKGTGPANCGRFRAAVE
jgi:hypothetical protein